MLQRKQLCVDAVAEFHQDVRGFIPFVGHVLTSQTQEPETASAQQNIDGCNLQSGNQLGHRGWAHESRAPPKIHGIEYRMQLKCS